MPAKALIILVAATVVSLVPARSALASFEPAPGDVVVHDSLGDGDWADVYFPAATEGDAVNLLGSMASRAGIPNEGVEAMPADEEDPSYRRFRLETRLGENSGFWTRTIEGDVLESLRLEDGRVVLSLHPRAEAEGDLRLLEGGLFFRRYEIVGGSPVTYRVPVASLAWLLILPLFGAGMFAVLRWYARRVERQSGDDADKVHRLQVALTLGMMVPSVLLAPLLFVGGLFLLPGMLLSEVAPGLTDSRAGTALPILLVIVIFLVFTIVPSFLAVYPFYAKVRGITERARSARKQFRWLALGFLPFLIWVTLNSLLPEDAVSSPLISLGVFLLFFLGLLTFFPLVIMWIMQARPIEGALRRRLLDLCKRQGLRVRDIMAIQARQEKMANALIAGILPRFRYVFVTDYLLDEFSAKEAEAVLAHEIGHGKQHHILIKAFAALIFLAAWAFLLVLLIALIGGDRLLEGLGLVALFTLFPLIMMVGFLLIHGVLGLVLERRADDYAADAIGVEPTVQALERLAEANTLKKRTGLVWNMLQQHPGIQQRVDRLKARQRAAPASA